MRSFVIVALTALVLLPTSAAAQGIPGLDALSLSLSPSHPRPYDTVTLSIGSTLIDLATSDISILVDGVEVANNTRRATFAVGGPGTRTVAEVRVTDGTGASYISTMTIEPADVALVLEASSTVPPFYPGAALVASEDEVRLIALPDFRDSAGNILDPTKLSYTWRFGNKVLNDSSGIGKRVLTAISPVRYRDAKITVTVATPDQSIVAEASRTVSAVDPILRVYRNDPLGGIEWAKNLSNTIPLQGDEDTFHMAAYFFPSAPELTWEVNGSPSNGGADITVRRTGNAAGNASLRASAKGTSGLLPLIAEQGLTIQFGKSGLGFFGL